MKKFLLVFLLGLFVFSCTEILEPRTHTNDWMDSSSDNFHGKILPNKGMAGIENCKSCHGEYFLGGSAEVSCAQCHAGGKIVHPATLEFVDAESPSFHGLALSENGLDGLDNCRNCHGEYLEGGAANVSCSHCHAGGYSGHPAILEFMDADNPKFHGLSYLEFGDAGLDHCKDCHGDNLDGGFAEASCDLCHEWPL